MSETGLAEKIDPILVAEALIKPWAKDGDNFSLMQASSHLCQIWYSRYNPSGPYGAVGTLSIEDDVIVSLNIVRLVNYTWDLNCIKANLMNPDSLDTLISLVYEKVRYMQLDRKTSDYRGWQLDHVTSPPRFMHNK